MKSKIILFGILMMSGLLLVGPKLQAQTVSGTVTDAKTGNPLVGVNILVVGTTRGSATDVNGHYSVNVSSLQDTLRFSFIGYATKKVPINGRITINVELKPAILKGNQMVVIGYGSVKRRISQVLYQK